MRYHEVNFIEMRVIGCLLEKEITTPDQYPLSLNALVNACNQKSNREPVTQLSESVVQDAVNALVDRGLVTEMTGSHSRVSKYQHRFCNTEFSDLQLSSAETAIICLLFLRGAQTPGELRSRSGRLHSFQSLDEVTSALQSLQTKTGGPYVCQLPREPGKREQRYQECFCNESERPQADVSVSNEEYTQQLKERILELEAQVEKLNERIQELENASGL
ncbi:YceH family protein [Marinomonas sp. RS-M-Aa-14]|uniref:YceH family protein n=1 Tax=Marinomonas sp. RS-M-Aa-14 TaxID=3241169 RepID=UPI00390C53E1